MLAKKTKRIFTALLITVSANFGHPHESGPTLSDLTFEIVRENRIHTKLLLKEAGVILTIPKSWNLSSPSLLLERDDLREFEEKVFARYPTGPGYEWFLTYFKPRKTEKEIRFSSYHITERFSTDLEAELLSDVSHARVDIVFIKDHSARELAGHTLREKRENIDSVEKTISPNIIEAKMSGLDVFYFRSVDTHSTDSTSQQFTYYYFQIEENVLCIETSFDSYATEKQVKEVHSIATRLQKS